jgi:hypothetical protein
MKRFEFTIRIPPTAGKLFKLMDFLRVDIHYFYCPG